MNSYGQWGLAVCGAYEKLDCGCERIPTYIYLLSNTVFRKTSAGKKMWETRNLGWNTRKGRAEMDGKRRSVNKHLIDLYMMVIYG